MNNLSPFHEIESYQDKQWDPFEDDFPTQPQPQTQLQGGEQTQLQEGEKLSFCQLRDWDEGRTSDEHPPQYIHYSVDWNLTRTQEADGSLDRWTASLMTNVALKTVRESKEKLIVDPALSEFITESLYRGILKALYP